MYSRNVRKSDGFYASVLRHISYVEIQPTKVSKTKKKPAEDSAEEFYEGLKEAIHDVNEHIAGRLQLQTLGEFLDEYENCTHS